MTVKPDDVPVVNFIGPCCSVDATYKIHFVLSYSTVVLYTLEYQQK